MREIAQLEQVPLSTGQEFAANVSRNLDHVLIGEPEAKTGIAVSLLEGHKGPAIFTGSPGGGKTLLSRAVPLLVRGMADNVAAVPPSSELRPQELVGGHAEISKTVRNGGGQHTETITTDIEAILKPDTRFVIFDEINRASPFGMNAALELMEEGHVTTTAGRVAMSGLECIVATMNPTESKQGTFPISHAMASRFAVGVVLGRDEANQAQRRSKLRRNWKPEPEKITPFLNIPGLHRLREEKNRVAIPDTLDSLFDKAEDRLVSNLAERGIHESDGRITVQLANIARSLAYLGAQESVAEKDVNQAVRFIVAARLGALSRSAYDEINNVVEDVVR